MKIQDTNINANTVKLNKLENDVSLVICLMLLM